MHRSISWGIVLAVTSGACGGAPAREPFMPAPPPPATAAETPPEPDTAYEVLLAEWVGRDGGVPPWDAVETRFLEPAVEKAGEMYLAEIRAIADGAEPPTFDNTLVAMERSGKALDRVLAVYSVMTTSRNTPEVQKASEVIEPRLSEIEDRVHFDEKLFARVKAVYDAREKSGLSREQRRLVEKVYDDFVRRGAKLDAAGKARLGTINRTLAELFTDFGNRVQADEDTWVRLTKDDLAGLPESLVKSYEAAAKARGVDGWVVVNTRSAVEPFLTFSERRATRRKVWRAFVDRGDHGDDHDTNDLIAQIVKLRAERAKLLGYASHAHWRMSDTMAKDPKRAETLMMRVWPAAVARVKQEVADMKKLPKSDGEKIVVEPWDYRYYQEKVRKRKYALDQNEFKNYFVLENMIQAAYYMAGKLYGYAFEEITGTVPVFHPDVRVFRVTNEKDGSFVGILYRDDFARQYKHSGAWQDTYRTEQKVDGMVHAIVSNNNNFVKGAEGEPVLISLEDARTLFHEFGHALHALTMDVTYPTMARTPRDFVEFPSQVHENWVLTREILDRYARHVKTGERMPEALIEKMRATSTFNQGFATVEYLSAAILDMKIHTDPSGVIDPDAFEKEALKEIGMPRQIVLRHRLPQFLHLFTSDAYSAGYYSYLWSDVMAADAWQAFEETRDPFDPKTAEKFKTIILASGDAIDRAEAYREFRGRDPKVEALLKNRGFPVR